MNHKISTQNIAINVHGALIPIKAYLAKPSETDKKFPAVIVVMELFGVNANIRDITNRIAELGYVAIAPDFYYRAELGYELPYGEEGRNKGFKLLHTLKRETVIKDLEVIIGYLKTKENITERMGIVGFSMGGHIAYLAATQFDFAATACLYGGWITNTEIELSRPEPTVSLSKGIAEHNGKLVYFAGGLDTHITKDQLDLMETKLKEEQVRYELVEYPNCSHGFFCDQRPADYNAKAHDDSWKRLKELFKEELGE